MQEHRLCRNCLLLDHHAKDYNNAVACTKCKRNYHILLHIDGGPPKGRHDVKKAENINTVNNSASFAEHSKMPIRLHPVLPIIPAKSQDGRHQVLTYALLDSGSTNTFCSEELANELYLTGRHASIPVSTVDQVKIPVHVKVVNFKLMDVK